MSTKYSISRRLRWSNETDNPQFTDKALRRWDERTPPGSIAPETAFEQAVDVSVITPNIRSHRYGPPDAAYYYYGEADGETYGAVFIINDGVIKSVYRPTYINHGPTRAYLAGYNHAFLHPATTIHPDDELEAYV